MPSKKDKAAKPTADAEPTEAGEAQEPDLTPPPEQLEAARDAQSLAEQAVAATDQVVAEVLDAS
jgi:hypothetical protein